MRSSTAAACPSGVGVNPAFAAASFGPRPLAIVAMMVSMWRLLALAAVGLLAGAITLGAIFAAREGGDRSPNGPYRGSEPPTGLRAPDFTLRDSRGRPVRMGALRGRVVILSFVDTKCKEKCPIVTSVIAAAFRRLPPAQRRR